VRPPPSSRVAPGENAPAWLASIGRNRVRRILPIAVAALAIALWIPGAAGAIPEPSHWHFSDVTSLAGISAEHGYTDPLAGSEVRMVAAGAAAGDYDRDGRIDLYVTCGDLAANILYHNDGDGVFRDATKDAGLHLTPSPSGGPLFFDYDGDGWLDLFVGGIEEQRPSLYHNRADGTFEDVTEESGLALCLNCVSATAGDFDGDGRLDLFLSHWGGDLDQGHLWRNLGNGRFECVDRRVGLADLGTYMDMSFTANFTDLDGDGFPELLLAIDFGLSGIWRNDRGIRLYPLPSPAFTDENGMGAAVGDYDDDGDMDWFVTSIWDGDGVTEGNWGATGNRLYRNLGDDTFEDATDEAGVRQGSWGWGASFADLNNDGYLDLVHVNGWPHGSAQFRGDPSRLFVSDRAGHFIESADTLGFHDTAQGRGVICFDYDRDGDLDIFVSNYGGPATLWRNDGGDQSSHLDVCLSAGGTRRTVAGARITVTAGGLTQVREIRYGSNYASQNPPEAHFGLGGATRVERIEVIWPDGRISEFEDVPANRLMNIVWPGDSSTAAARPLLAVPNPFRGSVLVTLQLGVPTDNVLEVFDPRGRLVRRLLPSFYRGAHAVFMWNGSGPTGRRLADGIYYLHGQDGNGGTAASVTLLH
jgi:hypothetical protein